VCGSFADAYTACSRRHPGRTAPGVLREHDGARGGTTLAAA